jgi:hypothetical protein
MLLHLDREALHKQVTVLAWLHFGISSLIAVIGIFVFTWMGGVSAIAAVPEAGNIRGTFAGKLFVFVFVALFSLPSAVAGYALLKRRPWARGIAIFVSLINLFQFPIGSLLGANTLWTMLQASAPDYFAVASDDLGE